MHSIHGPCVGHGGSMVIQTWVRALRTWPLCWSWGVNGYPDVVSPRTSHGGLNGYPEVVGPHTGHWGGINGYAHFHTHHPHCSPLVYLCMLYAHFHTHYLGLGNYADVGASIAYSVVMTVIGAGQATCASRTLGVMWTWQHTLHTHCSCWQCMCGVNGYARLHIPHM